MKMMLVDRDAELQSGLRRFVSSTCPKTELLVCNNGREALRSLSERDVDILILDIACCDISAHEMISRSIGLRQSLAVIAYTEISDRATITSAIRAGATGYLLKHISCKELWEAALCILDGGAMMSPKVSRVVMHELQIDSLAESLDILTSREKQVFQCIEEGTSYKAISLKLNISRNTVHTHVKNIYSKLQAVNKADAISKAKQIVAA